MIVRIPGERRPHQGVFYATGSPTGSIEWARGAGALASLVGSRNRSLPLLAIGISGGGLSPLEPGVAEALFAERLRSFKARKTRTVGMPEPHPVMEPF